MTVRPHLPAVAMSIVLLIGIALAELDVRGPAPPGVELPVPTALEGGVERLRSVPIVAIGDSNAAAIASGVVFGRTEHVTAEDEQAFLESGLWHLLAASGQNVALVVGCCLLLARAVGAGRTTGAVLALAAIPGYVLVVGGGASIVRAGAMAELAIVAWLAGRLPRTSQLLLAAAATICWCWPGAHRSLGMQLSFACVAALVCWAVPLTRRLRDMGIPAVIAGAIAATALCSAATAPILVLRTGAAPLAGIVANVVAVPLAAGLLVSGLVASIAASLLPDALAHVAAPVLLWPAGELAALLRELAHRAASLPASQTSSPLLAIGLPAVWLASSTRLGRAPRMRRVLAAAAIACVTSVVVGAGVSHVPGAALVAGRAAPPADGALRIGVLDVGQGDATLLASRRGAGPRRHRSPGGRVVDRVRALGIGRVDGIVLTHDSLDHRGGFEAAVAALRPRWIAIPRGAPGPWQRIRDAAPELVELCAGDELPVDGAEVDVLHPRCDGRITPRTGDLHNDGAMVLLVRHGDVRALLPADAEGPVLLDLGLPTLELLRVSHHGSRDPALADLLARTTPQVAAISAGEGNDYGHPTPSVLATLRAAGVRTFRTDRDGNAVFDSDGAVLRLVDG